MEKKLPSTTQKAEDREKLAAFIAAALLMGLSMDVTKAIVKATSIAEVRNLIPSAKKALIADAVRKVVTSTKTWKTSVFMALQQSFMKKRKEVLTDSQEVEYLRYMTKEDSRVRPAHRAMNRKVFPKKDPIWKKITPPNGFGCRCWLEKANPSEYDKNYKLPKNVKPDKGFDIPPGSWKLTSEGYPKPLYYQWVKLKKKMGL